MDPPIVTSRADDLFIKASKMQSTWIKLFTLFGFVDKGNHYTDIAETYEESAELYKHDKEWTKSINAYNMAITTYMKINQKSKVIELYNQIYQIYKISMNDIDNAIKTLETSLNLIVNENYKVRSSNVAKIYENLASMYTSTGDYDKAVSTYQLAISYLADEQYRRSDIRNLTSKIAEIYCNANEFDKAAEAYSQLRSLLASDPRASCISWLSYEYMVRQALCYLANEDIISCKRFLSELDMPDNREKKFLATLLNAIEIKDYAAYTKAIKDYHFVKSDQVLSHIFSIIENTFFDNLYNSSYLQDDTVKYKRIYNITGSDLSVNPDMDADINANNNQFCNNLDNLDNKNIFDGDLS